MKNFNPLVALATLFGVLVAQALFHVASPAITRFVGDANTLLLYALLLAGAVAIPIAAGLDAGTRDPRRGR